jgi:hypothetical protein
VLALRVRVPQLLLFVHELADAVEHFLVVHAGSSAGMICT